MEFSDPPQGLMSRMINVAKVLSEPWLLKVPRFQRPYSWLDTQVGRLIEDLLDAFRAGARHYFIGTVVLLSDQLDVAEIVDGQQRLTTLTVILALLRDRVKDPALKAALQALILEAGAARPRLSLRPEDDGFLREFLHTPGRTKHLVDQEFDERRASPQDCLVLAAQVVDAALNDAENLDAAAFAKFVATNIMMNLIQTSDRLDAPRLFTVLNDTGLTLSVSEFVKAELFKDANLNDAEAEEYGARWEVWFNRLGRHGLDELIRTLPLIYSAGALSRVEELGPIRRYMLNVVDPRHFLAVDLPRYGEAALALKEFSPAHFGKHGVEGVKLLKCLRLVRDTRWFGVAVALLADHSKDPDWLIGAFRELERFVFAGTLNILEQREQNRYWGDVYKALAGKGTVYGPGGALDLTAAQKRRLIERMLNPFRGRDWRRRAILMRLNAALPGGEVLSLDFMNGHGEINIEHILPLNGGPDWHAKFPDAKSREAFANSAGNMTLLTREQNEAAGDLPYKEKQPIYFNWPGAPIFALTAMLRQFQDWNPTAFRQRQEMLHTVISHEWRIPKGS
jgi:hypothetical protein